MRTRPPGRLVPLSDDLPRIRGLVVECATTDERSALRVQLDDQRYWQRHRPLRNSVHRGRSSSVPAGRGRREILATTATGSLLTSLAASVV